MLYTHDALQHTAARCNALRLNATHCNILKIVSQYDSLQTGVLGGVLNTFSRTGGLGVF